MKPLSKPGNGQVPLVASGEASCLKSGGPVERAGPPPPKPAGRIDAQVFGAFHKASRTGF